MPYKLRGTAVVKADTGEVVKKHPTREKALAHLRALKVNVENQEARLCECGAPARGPACQRGHRLVLREDWAKYDASRVGHRVVRKRVEGSRATAWSDEHGLPLLAAHPDDEVQGRFFLDGQQQDDRDYGFHESRGEAEDAGDMHAERILGRLRSGKMPITYAPVNGKLTVVNKDLKEAWSPEARAAAAASRKAHQKVWMHPQTGHQFREGDQVAMPGSPTGQGTIKKLVVHGDTAKVRVSAPHGEFDVEPDSLRAAGSKPPPGPVTGSFKARPPTALRLRGQ